MNKFKQGNVAKLIEENKSVMVSNSRKEKGEVFYNVLYFYEGDVKKKEVKENELTKDKP